MCHDGLCSSIYCAVLFKTFVDLNMGKFLSKHVSKRRQSPEGGSLSSSVLTCQREMEHSINRTKLTENLYVEVKKVKSEHNCNFKVVLPPKKTPDNFHFQLREQAKRNSFTNGTVYSKVPQPGQEWVFTLYNFDTTGKVTKEDMSSLILSMYEVLQAAVKQPRGRTTPLKIKLVVTPSPRSDTEKEQSTYQEQGQPVKKLYCVGENIERRNHYLDLAGIENYSSKFDNTDSSSHGLKQISSALQHHPVAISENDMPRESLHHFFENKAMSFKKERSRGVERACRLHGQHPTSWCHPAKTHLQRSHSKRLHARVQDSTSPMKYPGFQAQPGRDRQISNFLPTCEVTLAQRHDHHHHHEHHHHHHYHHS